MSKAWIIEGSISPLHIAAYNADAVGVLDLIRAGAPVDRPDEVGFTPLHWCCFRGRVGPQIDVALALIAAGANPDALTGDGTSSCMIFAVDCSALDVAGVLLDAGADVNLAADGVTPLMVAARNGDDRSVGFLLHGGAIPDLSPSGSTAADYARHGGHESLALRLESANPNAR